MLDIMEVMLAWRNGEKVPSEKYFARIFSIAKVRI
jgi:hypothetical protein